MRRTIRSERVESNDEQTHESMLGEVKKAREILNREEERRRERTPFYERGRDQDPQAYPLVDRESDPEYSSMGEVIKKLL